MPAEKKTPATPEPAPRRGRPATGRTPDSVRQAKTREDLLKAGGKRVSVNLQPEAVAALAAVRSAGHATDTEAIAHALVHTAKGLKRRKA